MNLQKSLLFVKVGHHYFFLLTQLSNYESIPLIYLIILGFLAPDKVDSKFFDPKFAFKEVEVQAKTVTELVTKKKPKVIFLFVLRIGS